jgi:type IX secretion system PorP/SprF family membrane protein
MKIRFIFLVALFSNMVMIAQDNYFAAYNTSKTNTNPAFTGSDSAFVLSSAAAFQQQYNQVFVSADNYFRRLRGGLGFNYNRENIGDGIMITSRVNLTYAPHFEFFHHRLAFQPALSLGLFEKNIDWSRLTYGDMIDERKGFVYDSKESLNLKSKSNIDISGGILLYAGSFYGGFAVHHINQPDEGLLGTSKLPARYILHGGMELQIGSRFQVSPNVMFQQQQNFSMFLLGATVKYSWLVAGIAMGNSNTFVSTVGIQNRFFKISYSYYNINPVYYVNEIHFNWFFKHRKISKVKSIRLL